MAPGPGGLGTLSAGPRTDQAHGSPLGTDMHKYTVAGQFRIRTGFPCGDSEHEHTSCAGLGKHPHMLCRVGFGGCQSVNS